MAINDAVPPKAAQHNAIANFKSNTIHSTGQIPLIPPNWAELTKIFHILAPIFVGRTPKFYSIL